MKRKRSQNAGPEVQDLSLRYGGRVVCVTLYVNTDADALAIGAKMTRIARGTRRDAALSTVAVYKGEKGEAVWKTIQEVATEVSADPRAESVDENWRPQ
jgi:hypothetical protein